MDELSRISSCFFVSVSFFFPLFLSISLFRQFHCPSPASCLSIAFRFFTSHPSLAPRSFFSFSLHRATRPVWNRTFIMCSLNKFKKSICLQLNSIKFSVRMLFHWVSILNRDIQEDSGGCVFFFFSSSSSSSFSFSQKNRLKEPNIKKTKGNCLSRKEWNKWWAWSKWFDVVCLGRNRF